MKLEKPPKHLAADGRAFWRGVLSDFNIDDTAGRALLLTACESLDRMAAARQAIETDGAVVRDRYGQPKIHPAAALEKDSRNGFLAALRALQLEISPPKPLGRPPRPTGWKP